MAKSKSSVIKIRNDALNEENIFSELAPQQQQQHLKANNDKNNNHIINIANNNNNNNNNIININNKQQDTTYKNANNFNKNFIPMENILLNQPIGINQDALNEQAYFQQANFNDGFVYEDLSMLPLIDDKAILNNLKSKFENQKYYVSFRRRNRK